jgi:hypothetical protein
VAEDRVIHGAAVLGLEGARRGRHSIGNGMAMLDVSLARQKRDRIDRARTMTAWYWRENFDEDDGDGARAEAQACLRARGCSGVA